MLSFFFYNYFFVGFLTVSFFFVIQKSSLSSYFSSPSSHFYFYISISSLVFLLTSVNFFSYNFLTINYALSSDFLFLNLSFHSFYYPFIYLMVVISLISVIFCLNYSYNELSSFLFYITLILISGIAIFFVDSMLFFFFFYECLLIPSFIILYKYSKTRKSVEASYLMFFWTQFGALLLIFAFTYLFVTTNSSLFSSIEFYNFSKFEINFLFCLLLGGFGVKLPLWPFYDWLPKAHVEASTNFSIFLSGVLVKFAFFGLMKCLAVLENETTFIFVFPYLLVGIVDSVFKMFYQIDLKKVIAYATVAEMHWLVICIISGKSVLWYAGFAMLTSHALMSTFSFLLVDSIARRFKTRLVNEISGINFICPKLFLFSLINLFIFLGFPGTLFFIAEFLFFTFLMDLFPIYSLVLIVFIYLFMPLFFLKSWKAVLFGSVDPSINLPADLDKTELLIFSFITIMLFWLGFTWESFIF